MTNTEAIKWLSKMPPNTPIIIEWWEQNDFNREGEMTDELWSDVCRVAYRKLSTDGWSEDIMYLIDWVKEK